METTKLLLNKLTKEEDNELTLFVGKAVRKNLSFPVLDTRVMNANRITVQDLFNASIDTLQKIGKSLRKMQNDFDPEFSSTEVQKIGGTDKESNKDGVEISELITVIKLIIKEKNYKIKVAALRKESNDIKTQLKSMKTPQELREELEAKLKTIPEDELVEA